MPHLSRSFLAATFLTLSWPALSLAQEPAAEQPTSRPRFEAGIYGGFRWFAEEHGLGRRSDQPKSLSPKDGPAIGLRGAYNLTQRLALEGEFQFTPTKTVDGASKMSALAYRLHALYHFIEVGRVRVFALAGLGGLTSTGTDPMVVASDTDVLAHLGVGTKVAIGDRWGLRLDLRGSGPVDMGAGETRYGGPDFEVLVGPYFTFGATEIREVATRVLDSDGDGLLDPEDKCPKEAEDKDGFEDADGCPDPDNDNDGVKDADDKCPKEAESKNGFQDTDGCPDELPPALKKFSGVIEGINFATGEAKILKPSLAILDKAAAVLKEFPEIKLEVSGHTDNKGKAAYNKDLSERRAQAVKEYLVSKGIDGARLTAVGYGMDKPLGENDTAAGRAKNRRTEFKLISNLTE